MSEGICSTSGMENSDRLGDRAVSGRQSIKSFGSLEIWLAQHSPFARGIAARGKNPRLVAAGGSLVQRRRKNILRPGRGR
jgi:hypothetical protein